MSMISTTNAVKQRKLTDLRVIDLQRELRSFNISYDKKELKGSLLEKLRQALVNRNLDPDNYLFDTTTDLKSISSDENNRTHEENGSHDINNSESSTMEIDSEQNINPENPVSSKKINPYCFKVQTTPTSSPPSTTREIDDDQTNRIDTINLRDIVKDRENENIFLTIIPSTTKQEDENNNDKIDHGLIQVSCSSSDEEIDTNIHPTNTNLFNPNIKSTTDQQSSSSSEDKQQTTTNLSNDNDNISKSEINRQESADEQQKKENTNKDQCHLWVSNIAKETHASDLKALFSKYGKVLTTKVIGSSSSQWFGYINLATPDDVEKCINALHQTELHGKTIYVDREMYDQPTRSSSSKSKSNGSSTSSSNPHRKRSDHNSHRKRDSITDIYNKSSTIDTNISSKKRSASISSENKKKFSTSDVEKSNNEEKIVKSHEMDLSNKKSNDDKRRNSSGSTNSQSSKFRTSRTDAQKTSEKSESSHKSITNDRKTDRNSSRSDKSTTDVPKSKTSSPSSHRSHSSEKRSIASSIEKSKQHTPSHNISNKYEKAKEPHRSIPSNTFNNDRRSVYQNEQRLRHEKEVLERKQYVQHQEEEKMKEQQRRLAEERERMRREFEILERERLEIERTRMVLEKEKHDQAREIEKQQRRLADEAKHRQHQVEAKIRDEKLHRLPHNENKRQRSSHHESPRPHHSNTNNSSSNNSNKGYDHRSSTNTNSGRGRDTNRDYYPEPKRQYINNANNQREPIFRDRVVYRESDIPSSSSGFGPSSSSSMASSNNNQRYIPASSNQHRPSDPYNTLPLRGRDMALPPASSVSTAYERSSRNTGSSPTNPNAILRRPHSRERFDDREYIQQTQRRDRSPPTTNTLRRELMEPTHWERSKPRDAPHYTDDNHKYLPTQYLSDSSQSAQQQQGLWSAAPPSRQQQQQHHHPDLPVKTASHAPVVDPYGWQRVSQQIPPQPLPSHHPQGLSSSHDRSRANVTSNQRIPILPSNQPPPPPPPPPPSSRSSTVGQTHLYSHPGVPVSALPTSQQHPSLAQPPPSSLHHTTTYVTQQPPPTGLVLHPTGQARGYEQHYVVTQPLPQRRY